MKLSTWIATLGGPGACAKLLGIPRETVYGWQQRRATPKVATMIRIVELTNGRVSYEQIIKETHTPKENK